MSESAIIQQIRELRDRVNQLWKQEQTLVVPLFDYSAASTIVGFSSLTVWKIFYKLSGKTLSVWYNFDTGTSNNAALTFTVPYTSAAFTLYQANPNRAATTGWAVGFASIAQNTNVITVYPDMAGSAWPTSGNKQAIGFLQFEIA